jgi:hypothetical protein
MATLISSSFFTASLSKVISVSASFQGLHHHNSGGDKLRASPFLHFCSSVVPLLAWSPNNSHQEALEHNGASFISCSYSHSLCLVCHCWTKGSSHLAPVLSSLTLSLTLSLTITLSLTLYLSVSIYLSLIRTLSLSFPVCLSVCLSLSTFSLLVTPSLPLSLSLWNILDPNRYREGGSGLLSHLLSLSSFSSSSVRWTKY